MSNTLPIALTRLLEHISTINSVWKKIDPYDHHAACWVTLRNRSWCGQVGSDARIDQLEGRLKDAPESCLS